MHLLIMVTLHIPICSMHELLCVCNIILLLSDLFRSVILVLRYSTLNILMLSSLLVSMLYLHNSILCLVLVFSLASIIDCALLKLKTLHLTTSNPSVDTLVS